jgi:hypothetical protein
MVAIREAKPQPTTKGTIGDYWVSDYLPTIASNVLSLSQSTEPVKITPGR